jgi:hypothetical protein
MRNPDSARQAASTAAVLVAALASFNVSAQAQGTAPAGTERAEPTVLPSTEALRTMSGMAGYYRATPTGDVYLYPRMRLEAGMDGMYGTYSVTPEGILLRPGGVDGITMAESAMGGAGGSFRITPTGMAYFYSHGN